MVGARTASRALGWLFGELFGELFLLPWCVVNEWFRVQDVLKCFSIPIG